MDDGAILNETLSKLVNKNLEGRVQHDRSRPVGSGGQGSAYKGTLQPSGDLVAVKEIRVTAKHLLRMSKVRASSYIGDGVADTELCGISGTGALKAIAKEIRICSDLDHPNIVTFIGFVPIISKLPLLVWEWVENGTLEEFLEKNTGFHMGYLVS